MADWQVRYVLLRGITSTSPMLHRWRPGAPWDALNAACGLSRAGSSYGLQLALEENVAATVPRCRRCWP